MLSGRLQPRRPAGAHRRRTRRLQDADVPPGRAGEEPLGRPYSKEEPCSGLPSGRSRLRADQHSGREPGPQHRRRHRTRSQHGPYPGATPPLATVGQGNQFHGVSFHVSLTTRVVAGRLCAQATTSDSVPPKFSTESPDCQDASQSPSLSQATNTVPVPGVGSGGTEAGSASGSSV